MRYKDAGYEVVEAEPPLVHEAAMDGMRSLFGEVKVLMEPDVRQTRQRNRSTGSLTSISIILPALSRVKTC